MRVHSRLESLFVNALSQSMQVELMQKVARAVIVDYDVYERSGFPSNIPMPRADAARQILRDFYREGYFLRLVEALIDIQANGFMGREVTIPLLPRILAEMEDQGYRYSGMKKMFVEAAGRRRTMGWGTLREGRTYEFALLRIDIVRNSELVRRYPAELIASAYGSVRDMVTRMVEKRDGRLWSWEGDGGLAAFYFSDKTIQATLCGIEIIHELFLYNLLGRGFPEPILARLAVHAGPCRFLFAAREAAGETTRRLELLESAYTVPGSLTVSPGVFTDLGSKIAPLFTAEPGPENGNVYSYRLQWETA
jgi:class 3 adenylate cyclase